MIDSYINTTSQGERENFMSKLSELNEKGEEQGYLPLDPCTEKYYFDKKWAMEDDNCRMRIESFENGDVYAIGNRQLPDNLQINTSN